MNGTLRSGAKIAAALFALFFIAAPTLAKESGHDKVDVAHAKGEPARKKAEAPRKSADYKREKAEYERKRAEFERKKAELAHKKADLDDVHRKIGNLHQEIAVSEATRSEVADALSVVERAISASQKRLREISTERSDTEAEIAEMEKRRDQLSLQLASQRHGLGETLYRYYVFGRKAGARRLLGGDDLNQVARDAYYLERLADARQTEIQRARSTLAEHERLIASLQQKHQKIEALEREQASERDRLLVEQGKRAKVLASVQGKLRVQRKEVASLKQDENRLGSLIGGLARLPAPKPPAPPPPIPKPQPKPLAQAKPQPRAQPQTSAKPVPPSVVARPSPATVPAKPVPQPAQPPRPPREASEPVSGHANEVADASAASEVFAALKGKLKWPARGELIGRFGAPRAEGGSQWKGVFIRASGGEVHAVAAGRVVYADWLRGFGNLIIIDHGNEYMTVYGNNEALFKTPGAHVRAGETIASVGSSGGSENSGLYFEIRYRGAPQDPAKWVAGR